MAETMIGKYQPQGVYNNARDGSQLLAVDTTTGTQMLLSRVATSDMEADDVLRAQRQIDLMAGLSHPNLIPVLDSVVCNGTCWLVTDAPPPLRLSDILGQGPLFEHEALRITRELASALDFLWTNRGIVHRDLKPDHVHLDEYGCCLLTGFGIAKTANLDSGVTAAGITVGTPEYMSPEQIYAQVTLDHRSDMYALGCLLYQMLDGNVPFSEGALILTLHAQMDVPHRPIREENPEVSPEAAALVDHLLQKDRDDRPATWQAVLDALPPAAATPKGVDFRKTRPVDTNAETLVDAGASTAAVTAKKSGIDLAAPMRESVFADRESVVDVFRQESTIRPEDELGREKYEICDTIAKGGMGEVALVRDHDLNRNVAMKTILPHYKANSTMVGRLIEEAQTVGQLEHPNIVPIYDIGRKNSGEVYFTMKYVNGKTLADVIELLRSGDAAAHSRFSWNRRAQIIQELCDALAFAHSRGVTHRDLKPANVMLGEFGEVVLMDWGLARISESGNGVLLAGVTPIEAAGSVSGTPGYMAPEQVTGELEKIGPRTDIFSLGVIIYELFSLHQPFDGSSAVEVMAKIATVTPVPLDSFKVDGQGAVPIEIRYILDKALSKQPEKRHGRAEDVKADLQLFIDGKYPIVCPHTAAKRAATGLARLIDNHARLVIIGGLFGALAAAAIVAWLAIN